MGQDVDLPFVYAAMIVGMSVLYDRFLFWICFLENGAGIIYSLDLWGIMCLPGRSPRHIEVESRYYLQSLTRVHQNNFKNQLTTPTSTTHEATPSHECAIWQMYWMFFLPAITFDITHMLN